MDAADAVMWTQPDSALAALESIDTLSLKTRARRARYSLLYTMALDRNGVDTADLRIIQPAVQYYERYGSNDDKMKMYYYLGTVQYFAGDLESSIKSFIQAKGHSLGSDNQTFIGLITSAISDVYAQNNTIRVLRIVRKPVSIFRTQEILLGYGTRQDIWQTIIQMLEIGPWLIVSM